MILAAVELELRLAQERLVRIYEQKGETDEEVLQAGAEVDRLLNIYDRLIKERG